VKTLSLSYEEAKSGREWWVVDATGKTLGRLASEIAQVLRGKHKPSFTPNVDSGDFVIVVNCDKFHVTGNRLDEKRYYRHSRYPGGLKSRTMREQLERHPQKIIFDAVNGMIPKTRLGGAQMKKLRVYAGPDHPHMAQKPKVLKLQESRYE
jgi:large subunit ribosomal protein L13